MAGPRSSNVTNPSPRRGHLCLEETVEVSLPSRRVFQFAAQPGNVPLWNSAVLESEVRGELRQGVEVLQRVDLLGRRFDVVYVVTRWDPPRCDVGQ